MIHICSIRAATEQLSVSPEALQVLGAIGARTSLRYAIQLLTPSKLIAETQGRANGTILPSDIETVDSLFLDGKASAQWLATTEGFLQ